MVYYIRAVTVLIFIQQTSICLCAPADSPTSPTSMDNAAPPKVVQEAASNATAESQSKYNSVSGLMNEANEFGTSSISSVGNAAIDVANNLGNLASNAAGQLVNTVGSVGELLGLLGGGLFTTGGQVVNQLATGVGGGLNSSGKTLGSSFKEFGSMFSKLGSQTVSVGGKTAAAVLNGGGSAHLSTRDYTWQG